MTNSEPEREIGKRLDKELFSRGIARSRSAALDLILRGKIKVNGKIITKANTSILTADKITMDEGASFVSRAGEKIAHALKEFKIDPTGQTVLDIGSSTGGFTDCLLQHGAAKIIAVDVGTDQLAQSLRNDPRIELHENTDVRTLEITEPVDLVAIDVSFISLEHIMPHIGKFIKKNGKVIVLVKPQFEVGKEIADKNRGIITDPVEQKTALDNVKTYIKKSGFTLISETTSPLEGEKGNKEFLLLLKK